MKKSFITSLTLLFGALVGVLVVIIIIFIVHFDPLNLRSPTDEYLIALLKSHHDQLEEFCRHYSKSSNVDSTSKGTGEDQGLIRTIPSLLAVGRDLNGIVRFVFAEGNVSAVGAGWAKGLEYVPENDVGAATIRENLDQGYRLPAGVYTRKIEAHWFIFYQKDE